MPNIEENPDFQLLKQFLQSINPNDMDEASATELMDLGKMIQNGGALTDRQREMFASVVGAMPDYSPADNFGSMSEAERELAMGQALPTNLSEEEMRRFMEQKYAAQKRLEFDARQRDIEAGNLPTGEAAGMTEMTSPMPRMRPSNLGG
jgi:hypothetical protein